MTSFYPSIQLVDELWCVGAGLYTLLYSQSVDKALPSLLLMCGIECVVSKTCVKAVLLEGHVLADPQDVLLIVFGVADTKLLTAVCKYRSARMDACILCIDACISCIDCWCG